MDYLQEIRRTSNSQFVAASPAGERLGYGWYSRILRSYCKALGLPPIGTHGLRHSTSALYVPSGASREDLRELFAHSDLKVTERYLHAKGTNLEKVANVIQLFPEKCSTRSTEEIQSECKCSTDVPRQTKFGVEAKLTT